MKIGRRVHVQKLESEDMTEEKKTALTEEILTLQNEINEFGRKSVPLIAECGKRLTEIQDGLPYGKWMDWQAEHSDVLSKSTINRYKRVYKLSLLTSLEGKTLTEVYELMKSKTQKPTDTPKTDETYDKESPLEALDDLAKEIIDTYSSQIPEAQRAEALRLIQVLVEFYNDQMELRVAA
jgi:hypothetical protein